MRKEDRKMSCSRNLKEGKDQKDHGDYIFLYSRAVKVRRVVVSVGMVIISIETVLRNVNMVAK